MPGIAPVSPTQPSHTGMTPDEKKRTQEQVAAGAGGAAGLGTQATRAAGKRGLAQSASQAESQMQNMMNQTKRAMQSIDRSAEAATGLWGRFKYNIEFYTNDILKKLEGLKSSKFIGPIINSPVTKKLAGFAGGALAFFVLITGVNKAVRTGAIAVDDFKNQYHEFKTAA